MKKYIFLFFIFILLLAGVIAIYLRNVNNEESQLTWIIFFYFSFLTFALHYGIVQTSKSRPQVFIRYYMAATTIKLLLHLGVIVIFSVTHKALAVPFILTFMTMYFLFTIFELVAGRKGK